MNIQKLLNLVFLLLTGSASAQPARCSYGYQDASCVGVLLNPPQVAPTCSSSAGWVPIPRAGCLSLVALLANTTYSVNLAGTFNGTPFTRNFTFPTEGTVG